LESIVAGRSEGAGRLEVVLCVLTFRAWSRKSAMVCARRGTVVENIVSTTLSVYSARAGLTMVSLNDLYLVVTSGPVVSIVGTTRVGMVPRSGHISFRSR